MNNTELDHNKHEQQGWIAWFAANPIAANLLMVMILLGGLFSLQSIKVEDFPSRPPNAVNVSLDFASGSAAATEAGVTMKLEQALQGIIGVESITSTTTSNSSTVTVKSQEGYDLAQLQRDVKQQVDSISNLPVDAETPVVSQRVSSDDAYLVQIHGNQPLEALQQVAEQLRAELLTNPNVEQIRLEGARNKEILIEVKQAELAAYGLSINDLVQSINAGSNATPGGQLVSQYGSMSIKADQQKFLSRDFAEIVIKQTASGQQLTLADVAKVQDSYSDTNVITQYNGQPAIGLIIQQSRHTNSLDMSKAADQIVAEFQQTLPPGIEVTAWYDASEYIVSRLGLLMDNSLIGIVIVMFLLALFLNVRIAFWVGVGLPVAFSGAFILMGPNFYGLSLNELTTFGFMVVLGIVVDDAVVIGESIYAERERKGASLASTIRGAQKVAVPTTYGVLTSVVAFMSLTLVEGTLGKIFAFFAYTAAFCLIFSLIESKLILPAHLANLRIHSNNSRNPIAIAWRWLQGLAQGALQFWTRKLYRPFINRALGYRYAVLMFAISIFIGVMGMVASGTIRSVFFPDIAINYVQVELEMDAEAGTALVQQQALELEQLGLELNQELQQEFNLETAPIPSIVTFTRASGATIMATLTPTSERPISGSDIAKRWQEKIGPMEAIHSVKAMNDDDSDADISIELRGTDLKELQAASAAVAQQLQQYLGVTGLLSSLQASQVQLDVQLNATGEALGLTASSLAQQLQHGYQGLVAQRIQRGDKEIPVKVIYPRSERRTVTDLEQAYIRTPAGDTIPLASVASVQAVQVIESIERIDQKRVAVLTASVDKSLTNSDTILTDLQSKGFAAIQQQYPSIDIFLSGEAQEEAKTTQSLIIVVLAAMVGIYGLLAIPLKSYTQPMIVMTAIPFGVIGALLGHWIQGIPVSLLSFLGIIALAGVVVNDSLLLINSYNQHRALGEPAHKAMVRAATGRMRAIILTSITTFAGLLPLMSETAESAQILIPAAVAMAYGILFATFITLLLIPNLVLILEDIGSLFKGNRKPL